MKISNEYEAFFFVLLYLQILSQILLRENFEMKRNCNINPVFIVYIFRRKISDLENENEQTLKNISISRCIVLHDSSDSGNVLDRKQNCTRKLVEF